MKYVERKEGQNLHDWCLELAEGEPKVFEFLRKVVVEGYIAGSDAAHKLQAKYNQPNN